MKPCLCAYIIMTYDPRHHAQAQSKEIVAWLPGMAVVLGNPVPLEKQPLKFEIGF